MPSSDSVAVVLAASAVGGSLGAILATRARITFEREEGLRTRMIEAADDFSFRTMEALLALNNALNMVQEEDFGILHDYEIGDEERESVLAELVPLRKATDAISETIEQAHARLPRVQLLFGNDASASRDAGGLVSSLRHVVVLLREAPPEVSLGRRTFDEASERHTAFNEHARAAIGKPLWDTRRRTAAVRWLRDRQWKRRQGG